LLFFITNRIHDVDENIEDTKPEQLKFLDLGMNVNMELGEIQLIPVCSKLEKETVKYYIVGVKY